MCRLRRSRNPSLRREKTAAAIQHWAAPEVNRFLQVIFTGCRKSGKVDLEAVEMLVRDSMHRAGSLALRMAGVDVFTAATAGDVQFRPQGSTPRQTSETES